MEQGEHFDVIVIGAGLSGISAAYHLQKDRPSKSFTVLEARDAIGGTWDLFRYPGIRSDSDMFTLGYGFRPWPEAKAIADGPSIKKYVIDTANHYEITEKIRFHRRVINQSWSSETQRWSVTVDHDGEIENYTCGFIISAAGYYRYDQGYTPDFPGKEKFTGDIIHPQHWPENFDVTGKRIVVIGSGATAVTLVPALAENGAIVTMLQRSPSYFFSMPGISQFANFMRRLLPAKLAHAIVRWQRVLLQQFSFKLIRSTPKKSAKNFIKLTREKLPEGYDVETHFTPRYNPWDQRLCVVPDDDLFEAIKSGNASIVTDRIERFTETGIALQSGTHIDADVIVTATGLVLQAFGGADVEVDHTKVEPGDVLTYKGAMFEGIPNFISVFGYTNASWTLRADLTNAYACRLINHLDAHGYGSVAPFNDDPGMKREGFLDFTSGYVTRAMKQLPKQGAREPWRHPQSYFRDLREMRFGGLNDGALKFVPKTSKDQAKPSKAIAAE